MICWKLGITALLLAVAETAMAQGSLKKILVLDKENYKFVEGGQAAVIFVVAEADTFEGGPELAKELEGQARVAVFNSKKLTEWVAETVEEGAAFLAKGYGKEEPVKVFATLDEAKAHALGSLPKNTVSQLDDYIKIQQWLVASHNANKLPALLFLDKEGVPDLLTKLSYWVGDSFDLGVVNNASPELKKQLQIQDTPMFIVMIPSPQKDPNNPDAPPQIGFQGAGYDKGRFGAMKFKNVLKFLGAVRGEMAQNGYFKDDAEKSSSSSSSSSSNKAAKAVPLFEYTADTADACAAGKLGLCIITVIDGSPLNEEKESQLQVIRDVQDAPSMKGRILTFVWVDHSCHPSFGEYFGVDASYLPSVIAVSAKKSAFAQHVGAFDFKKVSGFIGGVLGGKVKIGKLPGDGVVPTISADDDCEAAHAAMMPVEEDDFDMSDILAEMKAEEEEAAAKEAADKKTDDLVDPEIEAKMKRAQAEAEKMNKLSNKKKGKKGKGKKKKKKKAKKAKAEL